MSNLQALCYSCNAMKRDPDNTDFRAIKDSYAHRAADCLFCKIDPTRIITDNELVYAIRDAFPVTPHHTLIIPKRHVGSYFELGQAETNACTSMLSLAREQIVRENSRVTDFNIGVNDGATAGQTVP